MNSERNTASSRATLPAIFELSGAALADRLAELQLRRAEYEATVQTVGALLLRGLGAATVADFEQLSGMLLGESLGYAGGDSARTRLGNGVYTSTEFPAEYAISLHNELSYAASWPRRILFGCLTVAESGGETPIADNRTLTALLPAEVLEMFERRGVTYVRNLHDGDGFGRCWRDVFETADRAVVEARGAELGMQLLWKADGGLRVFQTRPATAVHPATGERVWFNQADQYHPSTYPPALHESLIELYGDDPLELPMYATFGDGGEIPVEALRAIRSAQDAAAVTFPWQAGDALIIDNMLVAHGRSPFTGPRRIIVSMA